MWKQYYSLSEAATRLGERCTSSHLLHYGAIGIARLVLVNINRDKYSFYIRLFDDWAYYGKYQESPIVKWGGLRTPDYIVLDDVACGELEISGRTIYNHPEQFMDKKGDVCVCALDDWEQEDLGHCKLNGVPIKEWSKKAFDDEDAWINRWDFEYLPRDLDRRFFKQKAYGEKYITEDMLSNNDLVITGDDVFITYEDLEALKGELLARENASKIKVESGKILSKEKTSMLLVIAALCRRANIDPTKRGVSKQILLELQEMGISIDSGTIKKYLDELPDIIENKTKPEIGI